ncbi:hypothetical protein CK203_075053 [Vitis vinifera]|uniref:Uncharacterized protein n=1 Tax=Vitis vinifera TaxID=29760 RepID=A0A438F9J8_VITVI|nr:hypothetical protein CK203_075053 [Vitis vinifera]
MSFTSNYCRTAGLTTQRSQMLYWEPISKHMLPMSSNAHSKDDKGTEERNGLRGRNRLGMENVSIFAYGVTYLCSIGVLNQSNISRGGSWNLNGFTVFCTMFDVQNPLLNMVSLTSAGAIPVADGRINPRFWK